MPREYATLNSSETLTPRQRSYRSLMLDLGPVGYWRLGERSGTVAYDSSGRGNNGTYVNAPTLGVAGLLAGDTDTAVTLNGTTQTITHTGIDLTVLDATFAIWLYPTAFTTRFLFGGAVGSLALRIEGTGKVVLTSPDVADATTMTNALVASTLVHIAVAYVHNGAVSYYRNGVLENTTGAYAPAFVGGALTDRIGSHSATQFFGGTIDEPAIWTRVLTATEIADLYAAGS